MNTDKKEVEARTMKAPRHKPRATGQPLLASKEETQANVLMAPAKHGVRLPGMGDLKHLVQRAEAIDVGRVTNHPDHVPHDHLFHEIVYVESGTAEHLTAAGVYRLHPGDVIVLRPRMWHGYRQTQDLTIINCIFPHRLLCQYWSLFHTVIGAFQLFRRRHKKPTETPPTILHAHPFQREQLIGDLDTIISERQEKPPGWQATVTIRLFAFLVAVARLDHVQSKHGVPSMASRAQEAIIETADYLESRYAETMDLPDLAARVHLSPAYLSRSFKRQMGMGIFQYLNHLRIEEACRLLRGSVEPIAHVAGLVGYDELTYFSRCFRQQMGLSPQAYRQAPKHADSWMQHPDVPRGRRG